MPIRTLAVALALAFGLSALALPARAGTTRYDPRRSGHPLRIVAYALHPVGVALDTLIFHPAWWLGTHEPLRTLFAEVARELEERRAREPAVPSPPSGDPELAPPND